MLLLFTSNLFFFVYLLYSPPCMAARPTPGFTPLTEITVHKPTWLNLNVDNKLLHSRKGSHVIGISEIKKYFRRYGYLPLTQDYNNTTNNLFDEELEAAINKYQAKLGLTITGKFDFETLSQISKPRCGVADVESDTYTIRTSHSRKNYVLFPGKPRWTRGIPMKLTYAFSEEYLIKYIRLSDIKRVIRLAFAKWAKVIPVSFVESDDYVLADIKIGFYSGDHGDGEPFDGVLGVLAHSFSPESGIFHLDAEETWAVDFGVEKSPTAVDLESVAVHEIGHLLGLAHSSIKDAVMYPSLKPRSRKVDLTVDDIEGVQALYGSNPNFTFGALLESDTSANQAADLRIDASHWTLLIFGFLYNILI